METLTDLEAVALGCIGQLGGCTAYTLRQHFRSAFSARFSDSAGSVYPMVTRLAKRSLLEARATSQGKRAATVYECSARGKAALRRWLAVPEEPERIVTWDPLRTRILYLGVLSKRERARWLDRAQVALEAHAASIRVALRDTEDADTWMRLAHRNALLQAQARLRWLREVRETLESA